MSDDLIGKTLGKYDLIERIGRGGMAEVYKAYHSALDRYVAIKVLHSFLGDDSSFKLRFEREARNIAQLRHPNIVQVYDFEYDRSDDIYYMVMEFINGPTLQMRLKALEGRNETMAVEDSLQITRTLADALAYAHDRNMIHRDLKPANIMFDIDGRVVLTDFGIAKIVTGPNMTATGSMVGTPAYMAPEQGMGKAGDHRSDIYSLGVVLFQMLTGTVPFNADTPIGIVMQHVNDPVPTPSVYNRRITPPVEMILYRTMQKDAEQRYQDIRVMIGEIDQIIRPSDKLVEAPANNIDGIIANSILIRIKSYISANKFKIAKIIISIISLLSLIIGFVLGASGVQSY